MKKSKVINGVRHTSGKVSGVTAHTFEDVNDHRKAASAVEHKDGTINVVDRGRREHYNGNNWQDAYDTILKLLGKG